MRLALNWVGPRVIQTAKLAAGLAVAFAASGTMLSAQAPDEEVGWTGAGVKHGVTLSYRDNGDLQAREVRAIAELPVPAESMFAAVCDFPHYAEFVPGIVEASELDRSGPNDFIVYLRYAPQFLVIAARDVVIHVTAEERTGALRCAWSQVTDRVPARPRTVRMPLFVGAWTVQTLDETRSRVIYRVTLKPGGSLPGWLVRWGAARAVPEEFDIMRKRAQVLQEGGIAR
ncbi:MAG: hypothetical protein DMF89_01665 [Acidobacteria bacterium]|nr:MAG: hypothetical protein DMF90_21065 [Acidobacteriota bacterium]PYR52754.1 MAG: hypothetical protein DMF89_01665 [Acidobacteriota bacterium]